MQISNKLSIVPLKLLKNECIDLGEFYWYVRGWQHNLEKCFIYLKKQIFIRWVFKKITNYIFKLILWIFTGINYLVKEC